MIDWSHSQQGDFDFCVRSWYIKKRQKRLNVWAPTPHYFVFGRIIHEIMSEFRFPYQGKTNSQSKQELRVQWEKAFQAAVIKLEQEFYVATSVAGSDYEKSQVRKNLVVFKRRKKNGLKMLLRHYEKASELPKPWKREDKFAISLGQGGPVQYWVVLDRLYSDGAVEDIKTGKRAKVTTAIKRQLLGYRAAVQRQYGFPWSRENIVLYLPTHKFFSKKFLQKEWDELSRELVASALCADTLLKRLRQGEPLNKVFPFHPDEEVCQRCRFRFPCREKGLMAQGTFFSMSSLYGEGQRTVAIEPRF